MALRLAAATIDLDVRAKLMQSAEQFAAEAEAIEAAEAEPKDEPPLPAT